MGENLCCCQLIRSAHLTRTHVFVTVAVVVIVILPVRRRQQVARALCAVFCVQTDRTMSRDERDELGASDLMAESRLRRQTSAAASVHLFNGGPPFNGRFHSNLSAVQLSFALETECCRCELSRKTNVSAALFSQGLPEEGRADGQIIEWESGSRSHRKQRFAASANSDAHGPAGG